MPAGCLWDACGMPVGCLWDSILGKLTSPTSSNLAKPRQTLDISKNRDSVCPEPARDDLAAEIVALPPCVGITAALGRDPTGVSIQSVRQRHRIDR
jgi:hypothetical protein